MPRSIASRRISSSTFSFGLKGLARFRANIFNQRGAVAAVFRVIPFEIKSFAQLNLAPVVAKLCDRPRGLILVTGPTGSGKSTTLAAMLDKINSERHEHIITIEDPIEFVHPHKNCLVNQREIHQDTKSFSAALRAALREDPDVVLIGEMRDLETIESALRIAETGHLDLRNPAHQLRLLHHQPHHRRFPFASAAADPRPVVAGAGGHPLPVVAAQGGRIGRAMAMEVLIPNPAIRNLIREDKIHQIYSSMQSGQDKYGMQTFNQSLMTLYLQKSITLEAALLRSSNPDELQEMINRALANAKASADVPARASNTEVRQAERLRCRFLHVREKTQQAKRSRASAPPRTNKCSARPWRANASRQT